MTVDDIEPGGMQPDYGCDHYCSLQCGNEYQFVVVTAKDSTTQFLCIPCFIQCAMAMVQAMVDPDSADVQDAVSAYNPDTVVAPGKRGRKQEFRVPDNTINESFVFDEFEPDVTDSA